MPPLHFPHEVNSLIHQLAEPIPPTLRDRFYKRVSALLSGCDCVSPGRVSEACGRAQAELLNAPETGDPPAARPSRSQPARGPFHRRA